MSRPRSYFPPEPGDPPPLRHTVEREVRFEELDPLAIVWHGRYASYFEDARAALGERYGIGYDDFWREAVLAPVRVLHVDYLRPLRFGERCRIEAALHFSEACRINLTYRISVGAEAVATGYTVQMLLDREENLLVVPPPFFALLLERWRKGTLAAKEPPSPRPPAFGPRRP